MPRTKSKKKTPVKKVEQPADVTSSIRRPSLPDRKRLMVIGGVLVALVLGYLLYKYLVIATVDGKPITRIALYNQLEKRYGAEAKNQLVAETLIRSEAGKRRVTVTPAEVDAEYQKFVDQYGGVDNINSALMAQGVSPDDFKTQLQIQILIKKMFASSATASAEEVKKYIEDNKDQFADATDTAKLESDVRSQLEQQKVTQDFRTWLQDALKSSRVVQ